MKKLIKTLFALIMTVVCVVSAAVIGYIVLVSVEDYKWKITEAAEVTEYGSPYKFYYNRLSNIEKHAYNEILGQIYDLPESVEIPDINAEQLDRIFSALLYDNPDLFFVGRKCTLFSEVLRTYCSVEYIMTKEQYLEQKQELMQTAESVISSLSDPDDHWQTELEIHDYIVDNCEYKLTEPRLVYSSSYGALVNGYAACEGYSKATKLLLDMAGIENSVVSGISNNFDGEEGAHMWNAVNIDGEFYYLDCTWDDPINKDKSERTFYSYFNLNEEMISSTHSDFSYDFGCTATAANYYVKTGKFFEDYSRSDGDELARLIADDVDGGTWETQLRFGSRKAYDEAVDDLLGNERIYQILSKADRLTKKKISYETISYYKNPEQNVLVLVPERG
ncbi:MAG: hypothetical protein IJE48_09535 [Clostridia bacterium]|nr:hypothetical protein [Clostridia bacterium]